jgi:hypothetical protein
MPFFVYLFIQIMNMLIIKIRMRKLMRFYIMIMNSIRIINQKQNIIRNMNYKYILNHLHMVIHTHKSKHFLKCILMLILLVKEV